MMMVMVMMVTYIITIQVDSGVSTGVRFSTENTVITAEQRVKEHSSFTFYMLLKVMNVIPFYNSNKHKKTNMDHLPSSHKHNKEKVSLYVIYDVIV